MLKIDTMVKEMYEYNNSISDEYNFNWTSICIKWVIYLYQVPRVWVVYDKDGHRPSLVILDTWHIDGGRAGLATITLDFPWYDQF